MNLKQKLIGLDACDDAIAWVGDRDLPAAWNECERGDWMIWLASRSGVDLRTLTAAKAACAEYARPYMKDERSIAALDAAHAFGRGEMSEGELSASADAAYAAAYAAYASAYAAYAYFAADAAYAAADAAAVYAAADAAADAAAAYAAADAAAADAAAAYAASNAVAANKKAEILRLCADRVREIINVEMINL